MEWEAVLHFLEGWVSVWIIWDSSAWEIFFLLSIFIYLSMWTYEYTLNIYINIPLTHCIFWMGMNDAVKCWPEYSSLVNNDVHYLLFLLTPSSGWTSTLQSRGADIGSPGLSFAPTLNRRVMPISSNPASSPAKSQGNSEEQGLASCKGTLLQFIKVRSSSLLSIGCCGPDAAKEINSVLWQP